MRAAPVGETPQGMSAPHQVDVPSAVDAVAGDIFDGGVRKLYACAGMDAGASDAGGGCRWWLSSRGASALYVSV